MDTRINGEKLTTRALQAALFLLALSAPISIAATQTAWALAILFWLIRLIFVRPKLRREPFDLAVLAFVGLTLVSSFFSYEAEVSLRKMVPVSLVTIAYLVSEYAGTRHHLHRLVAIVLLSCFAASIYAFATLAVGKDLTIQRMTADSPLRSAGVEEKDTILNANGINVNSPDEFYAAISQHSPGGQKRDHNLQTRVDHHASIVRRRSIARRRRPGNIGMVAGPRHACFGLLRTICNIRRSPATDRVLGASGCSSR